MSQIRSKTHRNSLQLQFTELEKLFHPQFMKKTVQQPTQSFIPSSPMLIVQTPPSRPQQRRKSFNFPSQNEKKTFKPNRIYTQRSNNQTEQKYSFENKTIIEPTQPRRIFTKRNSNLNKNMTKTWYGYSPQGFYSFAHSYNSLPIRQNIVVISNDFQNSFRLILSEIVELYNVHVYLKKKLQYTIEEIWAYLAQNSLSIRLQSIIGELPVKALVKGLGKILDNQFKDQEVQQMILKCFNSKKEVSWQVFEKFMSIESDFMDFIIERAYQKKFSKLGVIKLVRQFFRYLIQLKDLQKKLKMICNANQNNLIKIILSISNGQTIKVKKLCNLLQDKNEHLNLGIKLMEAKLSIYLDKSIGVKHSKYQFMKWLKKEQTNNQEERRI